MHRGSGHPPAPPPADSRQPLAPPSLARLDTSPASVRSDSSRRGGEYIYPLASAVSVAPPATPSSLPGPPPTESPYRHGIVPTDQLSSLARMNGSTSASQQHPRPIITSASVLPANGAEDSPAPSATEHGTSMGRANTRPLPDAIGGEPPASFEALTASKDLSPPDVSAWVGSLDHAKHPGPAITADAALPDPAGPQDGPANVTLLPAEVSVTMSRDMSTAQAPPADVLSSGLHSKAVQAEAQQHLDSLLKTSRFKHVQTSEGNMILDGRSDKLFRCQDEPIHAPGAVQSFGVLLTLEEEEEGKLQVQLVSENVNEVLGLTPQYLFSLSSFGDMLDEENADRLWLNIEGAEETTPEDLANTGPEIFQLTIPSLDGNTHACYAALQRAPKSPTAADDDPATMILELELVDDHVNPLETAGTGSAPESMLARPLQRSSERGSTSYGSTESTGEGMPPLSLGSSRGEQKITSPNTPDTASTPLPSEADSSIKEDEFDDEHQPYLPTEEQKLRSTVSGAKPLRGLAAQANTRRHKARRRPQRSKEVDLITILQQANEQLNAAGDLSSCLRVAVGILAEVTSGYSRVMVYQFDKSYNGQVVTELVSWDDTHDLYLGLRFPASDIPPQARDLYRINRTRLLYDRDQPTARLVARSAAALAHPLDMTHCMLRAMSPIHLKYLSNMRVRSSMSLSIMAFGQLWGLVALHNYGAHGKRVAFPLRRLCRLLADSISQNIERLHLAARLKNRRLGAARPAKMDPSGFFVSDPDELFHLFRADYGVISVGKEVKILGPLDSTQEVLGLTEYLRLKRYTAILSTSNVRKFFTDMVLPFELTTVAGLILIPLSRSGTDFMCFMRKPQIKHVHWAGNPYKPDYRPSGSNTELEANAELEPRKSFKLWMQSIADESLEFTPEDLDATETIAHTFGRFISIWRRQEQATQLTQLTSRLLSQARHDVRTPLHQILGFLELTLNAPLDAEAKEHVRNSYSASRSLLHTVNELLDLTRQSADEEPIKGSSVSSDMFDLVALVANAVHLFEQEAARRGIRLVSNLNAEKTLVVSDGYRLRQLIINVLSNAFANLVSETGTVEVVLQQLQQPLDAEAQPLPSQRAMYELSISDNGKGMPRALLESIFRALEEVETIEVESEGPTMTSAEVTYDPSVTPGPEVGPDSVSRVYPKTGAASAPKNGLGVGLAVVARTVKLLQGQLRVDSQEGVGTTLTFRLPFTLAPQQRQRQASSALGSSALEARPGAHPTLAKLATDPSESLFRPTSPLVAATAAAMRDSTPSLGSTPLARVPSQGSAPSVSRTHKSRTATLTPEHVSPQSLSPTGSRTRSRASPVMDRAATVIPTASDYGGSSGGGTSAQPPVVLRKPPKRPDFAARRASATGAHAIPRVQVHPLPGGSGAAGGEGSRKRGPKKAAAANPLRILIVDDDMVNRMILRKRLVMDGHTAVTEAHDGQQAVEAYAADRDIDVVLMDLQMPILDGQGASRAIRALEAVPAALGPVSGPSPGGEAGAGAQRAALGAGCSARRVPILAVSATLEESMRDALTHDGLDGWLAKPVTFSRLRELLSCIVPSTSAPCSSASALASASAAAADPGQTQIQQQAADLPAPLSPPWDPRLEFQPGAMDRGGWFAPLRRQNA